MSTRSNPHARAHDDPRSAAVIYLMMLVVVVAFGGFLWQSYSEPEIPRITAPAEPYKVRPPGQATADSDWSEETVIAATEADPPAPGARAGVTRSPQRGAAPHFVTDGPYVAQVAAVRSDVGVGEAWRRLSSRAPRLFERARLDVERADLGPRGVYFRVRAGYFPDRANAARFCERIRQMGQDCIITAR